MAMKFNRNYDVNKVISKLIYTVLALYVGGTILTTFGTTMNGTSSPLYTGLTLIGWTVTANQIVDTSGAGVLAVVGIIAIANVVMSFISFK